MVKKVFYNSSLPRAGSTLIQNILGQNPEIYTTPTSGLFTLIEAARHNYSNSPEFKAQDEQVVENAYRGFLKEATYGYFNAITDKPYVIDKSRAWKSEWNFINFYDENPKIICMVRDLRAVYASLEKKYRQNPQLNLGLADWSQLRGTNPIKRLEIFSNNPPIGPTLDRLYECILSGQHQHILFIKFEDLCDNPNHELKRIYDYLELPFFQHDFENIQQITHEDDKFHGVFGDHIIKPKLSKPKDDFFEVLGEHGCNLITSGYEWFYDAFEYKI